MTLFQLVIVRGNPGGSAMPTDVWFEQSFRAPGLCEQSKDASCFVVDICYVQNILLTLHQWKSNPTTAHLASAVTLCRFGNIVRHVFEAGFHFFTLNGVDVNNAIYVEVRPASTQLMEMRSVRAKSLVLKLGERQSTMFLATAFRGWAHAAKRSSKRNHSAKAFARIRVARKRKMCMKSTFSRWKIAALQKRTTRTMSNVRAEMEKAQVTTCKQEQRANKLEKTIATLRKRLDELRKRLADSEAISSAHANNKKTVEEIMRYAQKMFPRVKDSALVESFRRTSEMVGGDLQMLVQIASKISSATGGEKVVQHMKGVLRMFSMVESEGVSLTQALNAFTLMRFGECDETLGSQRLPKMWNRLTQESAFAYVAFHKRDGKSLLETVIESKSGPVNINTCMSVIAVNMKIPLLQLKRGENSFDDLLNVMWVKMADHQRRRYYVIRVRSLTQAKLANRAAHDEETRFNKSPCVGLCGIPVVDQTSFNIMFRMFGCYKEKLPCGKLERELMRTEPKEAMRLIAAIKHLLDVEASSRKHFVTIEDYLLLKHTDYAMRKMFLLDRSECFRVLRGLMGVKEEPNTERAQALYSMMREHIKRDPASLKAMCELASVANNFSASLMCMCSKHITEFMIPCSRHHAVVPMKIKN